MRFRSSTEPMIRIRWFVRLYKISTNLVKRSLPQDFSGNPAPGAMIIRFEPMAGVPQFLSASSSQFFGKRDKIGLESTFLGRQEEVGRQVPIQQLCSFRQSRRIFHRSCLLRRIHGHQTDVEFGLGVATTILACSPKRQFRECIFAYEEIGIPLK